MPDAAPAARRRRAAAPPAEAAPVGVLFQHPSGKKAKRVKPGFAWDLFLFAGVLGVPLFLRGLTGWGAVVLGLWVADLALGRLAAGPGRLAAEIGLFAAFLGLQLYLGWGGNALTARSYRARGWTPERSRDAGVRRALERWGVGAP
ncbi:MAG TPA: hypothetical protein VL993_00740 [Stellaceae bacterium]|nr:hypothetical protein [Stellaceae bacterium]